MLWRDAKETVRGEGNWILEKSSAGARTCERTCTYNAFMLQLLVSVRQELILPVRRPVEGGVARS